MAKKEIIKVAFKRERVETAMAFWKKSIRELAEESGVSRTTIQRGFKDGEINEIFADKIATALCVDLSFLAGNVTSKKAYNAMKTLVEYFKSMTTDSIEE